MPRLPGAAEVAGVALLLISLACSRQEAPKRTPPPDAKRVDPATAGTVAGRVTVDGVLPPNPPINLGGDPVCAQAHKDGATSETYISENGGLGNVFVYVKDGLGQYYFDVPGEPVRLDQNGCMYKPHVFGVRVGQNVEFVNSDSTGHNVHALPNANREFNFSQPIQNAEGHPVLHVAGGHGPRSSATCTAGWRRTPACSIIPTSRSPNRAESSS